MREHKYVGSLLKIVYNGLSINVKISLPPLRSKNWGLLDGIMLGLVQTHTLYFLVKEILIGQMDGLNLVLFLIITKGSR